MQAMRLNKIAERVTLVQVGANGAVTSVTLFKKKKKKSKGGSNGMMRNGEQMMGRVRDMGNNVFKMLDRGRKSMGIPSMMSM